MESRSRFCVENKSTLLVQKAAEELENWLKQKIDPALARLLQGEAVYLTEQQAEKQMGDFKAKIRAKYAARK
ncbi:hypothetical protein [Serratia aquatilis]|uniref:Uncharacterized protein n=1 Tax=Serratia aquatilis TaxID=1737515 RepID=A0ABV6E7I5_9GAMM